ncbi:MAG: ROK family protein [Ruminococcaceae bacterium]|nr:ROK family protein [Oscillospiraceae bacterium]
MRYAIGVDLGGTNIAVGLVDENFNIVDKVSVPTNAPRPAEEIVKDMAAAAAELAERNNVQPVGIGIGSPGIISGGVVLSAANLKFRDVPLCDMLEKVSGLKCALGNDANVAALGENAVGSGKDASSFVMVTLGTGVGGGIIEGGKIVEGFNGAGAEIGHFLLYPGGRQCGCGKKGCFEAYCSASGLIQDTKDAMAAHPESAIARLCEGDPEKINGKTAFDAMREGDATGKSVVDTYIYNLALGVSNIMVLLQPEILAIGGGISREGETLLAPLREVAYANSYFDETTPRTKIVAATLRGDAGIVGAAALILND